MPWNQSPLPFFYLKTNITNKSFCDIKILISLIKIQCCFLWLCSHVIGCFNSSLHFPTNYNDVEKDDMLDIQLKPVVLISEKNIEISNQSNDLHNSLLLDLQKRSLKFCRVCLKETKRRFFKKIKFENIIWRD